MKKLSVCIPCYERFSYTKRLVEQLILQVSESSYKEDVEICVSDNCSDNNIGDYMAETIKNNADIQIKFQKLTENFGPVRNTLEVVNMADSYYCWVVGNDDILAKEDTVDIILSFMERDTKDADFICFGFDNTHAKKNILLKSYQEDGAYFDFSKPGTKSVLRELEFCRLFLFYSSLIFKKSSWAKAYLKTQNNIKSDNYWHTCYPYFISLLDGGMVYYINDVLVIREIAPDIVYADDYNSVAAKHQLDMVEFTKDTDLSVGLFKHFLLNGIQNPFVLASFYNPNIELDRFAELKPVNVEKAKDIKGKLTRLLDIPKVRSNNVFLFGSGKLGALAAEYLLKNGIFVKCFIDNDRSKQGQSANGLLIISPEESLDMPGGIYVISLYDQKPRLAAYKQLTEMGVPEENIFPM